MADLDAKVDAFTNQMQEINTAMVGALTKKIGKTRASDMEQLAKKRAEQEAEKKMKATAAASAAKK